MSDEIDEEKNDIEDSLEELTKENEQLRAEVERLKACQLDLIKRLPPLSADPVVGQAFTLMLDAITLDVERSRAAQEERAAVVAFLRQWADTPDAHIRVDFLAGAFERGEHVKCRRPTEKAKIAVPDREHPDPHHADVECPDPHHPSAEFG